MSAAPRYGKRIEHAIVRLLIDELAKAGFVAVGIHHEDLARGEFEKVAANKIFAEVFEYSGAVTLHFAPAATPDSEADFMGVLLVNGNGEDIISDWHTRPREFSYVVRRVSEAAHKAPLAIVVQS